MPRMSDAPPPWSAGGGRQAGGGVGAAGGGVDEAGGGVGDAGGGVRRRRLRGGAVASGWRSVGSGPVMPCI